MEQAAGAELQDDPDPRPRWSRSTGGWVAPAFRWSAVVALVAGCVLIVALSLSLGGGRELLVAAGLYVVWSGVVLWLRHTNRIVGASATAILGVVGIAIGMGIGVERFRVTGLTQVVGEGLALLAVALVMVVVGLVDLGLSLGSWRGVGAVVVACSVGWFLVVPLVVRPVADALLLSFPPRASLGGRTPTDVGIAYRSVSFRAEDGTSLSGWYTPSVNGAAVVLAHGVGATRSDLVEHLAVLAEHGYGVLVIDPRGYADSGGRAMDLGWYGESDIHGAVDFLTAQPDVDPERIAVVGLSLGGEAAIGEASSDARVRAVVAEGASYRVLGDRTPRSSGGWLDHAGDWVMFETADLLTDAPAPSTLDAAVRGLAPRRLLLITGSDSHEEEAAQDMRASAPCCVEVWALPDTPHVGGLSSHPEEWEARVVGFLDAELETSGTGARPS